MAKFYLRILWSACTEFWGATDKTIAASTVVLFLIGLFNQKLVERIMTTWNGVSPWWSLVPIGLLVVYRLLRANYEKFVVLENKLARQMTAEEVKQQVKLLTDLIDRGQEFIRQCGSSKDLVPREQVGVWAQDAIESVTKTFDSTYISRFESSVGIPMSMAYWPNLENRDVYGYVLVRVYRLQEFVDELRKR